MPGLVRREPPLVVAVLGFAALYATYAVANHRTHFGTNGWDLGIFDQTVWRYSTLQAPANTVREMSNILGDHFEPILVVLAPLYWVWSDATMLLIAQAVLVAVAMVPIFLYAQPRVGRLAAYGMAIAYALFWGVAEGVSTDFHEVAFAPLLIALVVLFADRRQWTGFWITVVLLLATKESFAFLVAGLGLYLIVLKEVRRGLIALAAGVGWYLLVSYALIPLFADDEGFRYWKDFEQLGTNPLDAAVNLVTHPGLVFHELTDDPTKVRTLAYLFVPFGLLTLYSPLVLLAVPLILERMLADAPGRWGTDSYFSLSVASILVLGAADGLARVLRSLDLERAKRWIAPAAAGVMVAGGLVLFTRFPLSDVFRGGFYQSTRAERAYAGAIAAVPDDASVMAQDWFVPHLSARDDVHLISPRAPITDYIVADIGNPARTPFPNPSIPDLQRVVQERRPGYEVVYERSFPEHGMPNDVIVLRRRGLR